MLTRLLRRPMPAGYYGPIASPFVLASRPRSAARRSGRGLGFTETEMVAYAQKCVTNPDFGCFTGQGQSITKAVAYAQKNEVYNDTLDSNYAQYLANYELNKGAKWQTGPALSFDAYNAQVAWKPTPQLESPMALYNAFMAEAGGPGGPAGGNSTIPANVAPPAPVGPGAMIPATVTQGGKTVTQSTPPAPPAPGGGGGNPPTPAPGGGGGTPPVTPPATDTDFLAVLKGSNWIGHGVPNWALLAAGAAAAFYFKDGGR